MPTLPSPAPPVAIWELMPITRPAASSSGPPELPGLIAASVWMTLSIVKPLGPGSCAAAAETTPVVSVRSRPNGLPIAIVGSPTCTSCESPSASGLRSGPSGSTLSSARSVEASRPTTFAVDGLLVAEAGRVTFVGARDDVGVGEDVAVLVDHEARAVASPCCCCGHEVERATACCWTTCGADEDDAGRVALVDVAGGEAAPSVVGGASGRDSGACWTTCGRRLAAADARARRATADDDGAADERRQRDGERTARAWGVVIDGCECVVTRCNLNEAQDR